LVVKNCQNKLKFHPVVEKDRGYTWNKNQEKKFRRFFWANFLRGLNFYGAGCTYKICHLIITVR
jgi:hypothetical protein